MCNFVKFSQLLAASAFTMLFSCSLWTRSPFNVVVHFHFVCFAWVLRQQIFFGYSQSHALYRFCTFFSFATCHSDARCHHRLNSTLVASVLNARRFTQSFRSLTDKQSMVIWQSTKLISSKRILGYPKR